MMLPHAHVRNFGVKTCLLLQKIFNTKAYNIKSNLQHKHFQFTAVVWIEKPVLGEWAHKVDRHYDPAF